LVYSAAVTPFLSDGRVDDVSVVKLLAWFKANGCDGVILGGTTGEGPSLGTYEKRDLIRRAAENSLGMSLVLGTATQSLVEALWLCHQAREVQAEAVLVTPPSFYRESGQEGLVDWFSRLLDKSRIPVLLYNFPQRTMVEFAPETVALLAKHENMLGLKDSSGNSKNLLDYAQAAPGKRLFVGDETLLVDALAHGWSGTVCGAANVLGIWIKGVDEDFKRSPDAARAKLQLSMAPLLALRSAPQPLTHKRILHRLGIISSSAVRSPLLEIGLSTDYFEQVSAFLAH
jgi:4-hydroxy-tetrahydrodipicolinate synthase